MSQYDGLDYGSADEFNEFGSDDEYQSEDDDQRFVCTYGLDTMFEIITKRDFNKWKLGTIIQHYRQVRQGRKQLSR